MITVGYNFIIAKFIGKSGSSGYVNGEFYPLRVKSKQGMDISLPNGSKLVKYESLSAFLKNWDLIENAYHITANPSRPNWAFVGSWIDEQPKENIQRLFSIYGLKELEEAGYHRFACTLIYLCQNKKNASN